MRERRTVLSAILVVAAGFGGVACERKPRLAPAIPSGDPVEPEFKDCAG
jgi:hypothetical protein